MINAVKHRILEILRHKYLLIGVGILGIGLLISGAFLSTNSIDRLWTNLLLANWYFLCLSLFGMVFVSIHYVTNSKWAEKILPISMKLSSFLPVSSVLFLFLLLGINHIYDWPTTDIGNKNLYLNFPFLLIRTVLIFSIWNYFYFRLKRFIILKSESHKKIKRSSVLFILFFMATFTIFCWDWLVALNIEFHSTIFSIYHLSGLLLGGMAFLILAISYKIRKSTYDHNTQILSYDLGRFLLALSMIWFYIWFCQLLIIWYADIPVEKKYYSVMTSGTLNYLFILNLILNFIIPFILLLSKKIKQNLKWLSIIAIVVLIGRWVDYYLLIIPFAKNANVEIGLIEVGLFMVIGVIFMSVLQRHKMST